MKKLFEDIRRQNTPDLSLDEKILERARTMRAGKKEMLSAEGKEHIEMKVSMNRAESNGTAIVRKNHSALIAAAAAVVMAVGGVGAAVIIGRTSIRQAAETSAAAEAEKCYDAGSEPAETPVSDSSAAEETPAVTTNAPDETAPAEISLADLVKDWAIPYLEKNTATVGYIHIPGFDGDEYLKIDQPVVQYKGIYWAYALNHDFYGNDYRRGTLVAPNVKDRITITPDGKPRNTIIYGYNGFNEFPETDDLYDEKERGLMFTGLREYQQGLDFYKDHALIDYRTIYEDDGEYVVFAVIIYNADEETIFTEEAFSYEEHDFDEWLASVKKESAFEVEINCTAEDRYLTLVTPHENDNDYYRAVIAKKLTPDDDKQAIINSVQENYKSRDESASESEEKGMETHLEIPLPEGLRGSYTFDLIKDGDVIATKTIKNGEIYAGMSLNMDIVVFESETVTVYVRSNSLGVDNYIRYAQFDIDYTFRTVKADKDIMTDDILRITPKSKA